VYRLHANGTDSGIYQLFEDLRLLQPKDEVAACIAKRETQTAREDKDWRAGGRVDKLLENSFGLSRQKLLYCAPGASSSSFSSSSGSSNSMAGGGGGGGGGSSIDFPSATKIDGIIHHYPLQFVGDTPNPMELRLEQMITHLASKLHHDFVQSPPAHKRHRTHLEMDSKEKEPKPDSIGKMHPVDDLDELNPNLKPASDQFVNMLLNKDKGGDIISQHRPPDYPQVVIFEQKHQPYFAHVGMKRRQPEPDRYSANLFENTV
jgi:hypothetical protein